MELHKDLSFVTKEYEPSFDEGPWSFWERSLKFVDKFYSDEILRISSVSFFELTQESFLKECIWVIHATGFSSKAVTKFYGRLVESYGNFEKLSKEEEKEVISRVSKICNNPQKIKAIHSISKIISDIEDWDQFKAENLSDTDLLQQLPYIGKVTCFHLGRNIGLLDCVKPDLHLIRLAELWGFESCYKMCKEFQGYQLNKNNRYLPLGVIDYIIWIYSSTFGTLKIKKENSR